MKHYKILTETRRIGLGLTKTWTRHDSIKAFLMTSIHCQIMVDSDQNCRRSNIVFLPSTLRPYAPHMCTFRSIQCKFQNNQN